MSFQGPIYTDAGKALHNRLIGTGTLKFTKMQMGDGSLGGTTIAALTALINPLVTMEVQQVKQYSDYVVVTAPFTNATITAAFNWREIGLFVADPDYPDDRTKDILFCYQNAYSSAAPIPPGSQEFIERLVNIPIKLSDVSDVTITISASLIYALIDPLTGKIYPDDIPMDSITSTQAAAYSNTRSYAVGDYCTKDGQMYKCNTPITAGEEWTADHWTATSMGAEFKAVNTALAGKAAANHTHTAAQVGADAAGSAAAVQANLTTHTGRTDNPHGVTPAQIGADPAGSAAAVQQAVSPLLRLQTGLGNEYLWRRYLTGYAPVLAATSNVTILMRGDWYTYRIKYSATLDPTTGNMVNPAMVEFSNTSNDITRISVVKGMYWSWVAYNGIPSDLPTYFTDASANITVAWVDNYGNNYTIPSHQLTFVNQDYNVSYVNSSSPTAYPVSDGYTYDGPISLGAKADIFFTQYGGSGTYGSSAPNTLVFPFKPKFVIICLVADTYNATKGPFWGDKSSGTTYGFSWCVGQTVGSIDGSNITFTQTGKTLSWYSQNYSAQLNQAGRVYNVIAF